MNKKLLAILFGSALVLGACGGGDDNAADEPADNNDAATEEPADEGGDVQNTAAEEIYAQSCASCHGQNLEGGIGPQLDNAGERLSHDEILSIIENGQGTMPPNLIQGEDAETVAQWLAEMK